MGYLLIKMPHKTDWVKQALEHWQAIGLLLAITSGYSILQYKVAQAEDKIRDIEGIKISQAKMESQLDYIYQAIKESRNR